LSLSLIARALGVRIVFEFHELLDTAELQKGPARAYVQARASWFMAAADGSVVHNEFDRAALADDYELGNRPIAVVPHGPYDQYTPTSRAVQAIASYHRRVLRDSVCRLLYFGVIRPFKGVVDIVSALEHALPAPEPAVPIVVL